MEKKYIIAGGKIMDKLKVDVGEETVGHGKYLSKKKLK